MALPGRVGGENVVTEQLKNLRGTPKFVYGVTQRRKELFRVDNTHKRYRRMWPKEALEDAASAIQGFVRNPEQLDKDALMAQLLAHADLARAGLPTPAEAAAASLGWWRMIPKFTQYHCMRRAAIRIEAATRTWMAQRRYCRLQRASLRIATWWRTTRTHIRWLQVRLAALMIIRWWKPYVSWPLPGMTMPEEPVDEVVEMEDLEDLEDLEEPEPTPEPSEESEEEGFGPGALAAALDELDADPQKPKLLDPHFRELGEYYWRQ